AFFVRVARAGTERASLFALAELPACPTLQSTLIGTQTGATVHRKHALDLRVRTRNHVYADQLTDASRCSRACVSCCLHSANVAAHKDRHIPCTDVLFAEQLYIRCFDHRIRGLNGTHESFGLNHSECFQGHLLFLTL